MEIHSDSIFKLCNLSIYSSKIYWNGFLLINIWLNQGNQIHQMLVLYTESGRYLLHRVWYLYEQEVKGGHFPGLRKTINKAKAPH